MMTEVVAKDIALNRLPIQIVNNGSGAHKQHCFEKCLCAEMGEGQVGMVNASVYHFKALLAQDRKGDLFCLNVVLGENTDCYKQHDDGSQA